VCIIHDSFKLSVLLQIKLKQLVLMPPSKPMPERFVPVEGYYFRSSSDSRERSLRRTGVRSGSYMTWEGQQANQAHDNLAGRITQLEDDFRHLEACREGLQAELDATKQIVRLLLEARRSDQDWFNGNAGGTPISIHDRNYWHETQAIAAIFSIVRRSENWRGAWDRTTT